MRVQDHSSVITTVYSPIGTVAGPANASQRNTSYGTLGVYYAFIQFAGFTIGKAVSAFDAPWTAYPGNIYDGLVGGSGTVTGVNQFTYTAEFGQGVSASISGQDPTPYAQAGNNNLGLGVGFGPFGTSNIANSAAPDIIGNVQIDQAWGLFKLLAVAHDNHAGYCNGVETGGHPSDRWGFAVQGALSIKNIPTGPGDVINMQAVYTDGATRYNIQNLAASAGANTIFGSTNVAGAYQSVDFGMTPDTVFGTGGSQQMIQTLGRPWCVQPQLGSLLEQRDLQSLCPGQLQQWRQDSGLRQWRDRRFVPGLLWSARNELQPELRHRAVGYDHPLDPGEEPDLLG